MRQLGGAFGIAILVAVFAGAGSYASAQAFSEGFAAAIGGSAGLSLAGAITGLALPARRGTRGQGVVGVHGHLHGLAANQLRGHPRRGMTCESQDNVETASRTHPANCSSS
jgi:hypothetical protein